MSIWNTESHRHKGNVKADEPANIVAVTQFMRSEERYINGLIPIWTKDLWKPWREEWINTSKLCQMVSGNKRH